MIISSVDKDVELMLMGVCNSTITLEKCLTVFKVKHISPTILPSHSMLGFYPREKKHISTQ